MMCNVEPSSEIFLLNLNASGADAFYVSRILEISFEKSMQIQYSLLWLLLQCAPDHCFLQSRAVDIKNVLSIFC